MVFNPTFGLDAGVLKSIFEFSTFQSLKNGELYFIDELPDSKIIDIASKIKTFLENQEIDYSDVNVWPKVFLLRLKQIYVMRGQILDFEEL